jgi:hypothetical protein
LKHHFFVETGCPYITQTDFEFTILLPQTPESWDYRHISDKTSVFQNVRETIFFMGPDILSMRLKRHYSSEEDSRTYNHLSYNVHLTMKNYKAYKKIKPKVQPIQRNKGSR